MSIQIIIDNLAIYTPLFNNLVMQFAQVKIIDFDRICHRPMLNWLQNHKKEASYDEFYHGRGFSKKSG